MKISVPIHSSLTFVHSQKLTFLRGLRDDVLLSVPGTTGAVDGPATGKEWEEGEGEGECEGMRLGAAV